MDFNQQRTRDRRFQLQFNHAVTLYMLLLPVNYGLEDNVAKLTTGTSCVELGKPSNGEFRCKRNEEEEEICKLVCDTGYTLPVNENNGDGKRIPLEHRGIYTCKETPGGMMWTPTLILDCIPIVNPAHFVFYYALRLTPHPSPCVDDSDRVGYLKQFESSVEMGVSRSSCKSELAANCYWEFDMGCRRGAWSLDAWFRIPYTRNLLENFDTWFHSFQSYTGNESLDTFQTQGQVSSTQHQRSTFFIECPLGTRMERDYICRGCSKGYFMSSKLQECLPCPARRYQDHDYSQSCKMCPPGSKSQDIGLTKVIDCYTFSYWVEDTSMVTLVAGLSSILGLSTLLLYYRSQVRNEPDGRHREVYREPRLEPVGGGPLLRFTRMLYPMKFYPSQFDNFSAAAQLASETTRRISMAAQRRPSIAPGEGSDEDEDEDVDDGDTEQNSDR